MRPIHYLVAICGFVSAASAWGLDSGHIIKHAGEPIGTEEVHNGGMLHTVL